MDTNVLKKTGGFGLVIIGFILMSHFFMVRKIAQLPFGSYHAWRQADCISITNNMYEGRSGFFQPRTHFAKNDGTGLAVGEFPAVNGAVAIVYKILGPSTKNYRYLIYFSFFIGLVFLYLLFYEVSKDAISSALMALLLSSGSILIYYAINFLPDVPAYSLAVVGLYLTYKSKKSKKMIWFTIGLSVLTLAALIKLTTGILLGAWGAVILVEMVLHGRTNFQLKILGGLILSFFIIVSWYRYAFMLDHTHPPFIFLTETRTYWNTYFAEKPIVWNEVKNRWLPQVFLNVVWIWIAVGSIGSIFFSKKLSSEMLILLKTSLLLSVFFFLMMYRQFMLHDYLWIGLLPVVVVLGLVFMQGIGGIRNKVLKGALQLLMISLLVLQVFQTRLIVKERYFHFDNNLVYNQDLNELTKLLREHGVHQQDLVISIPDPSPNITLVAMDQYGFTNYRETNNDGESINEHIKRGAKFLIISKESEYEKDYLKPYFKYYMFSYKRIGVFDLR